MRPAASRAKANDEEARADDREKAGGQEHPRGIVAKSDGRAWIGHSRPNKEKTLPDRDAARGA
jgi:hypothetical protein